MGETPWVHLDIAGPSVSPKERGYNGKGGTGVGVRTLVEYVQRRAAQAPEPTAAPEAPAAPKAAPASKAPAAPTKTPAAKAPRRGRA